MFPTFPQSQVILTDMIPPDSKFRGLRIVHYQLNKEDEGHYLSNRYQFQHQPAEYTMLPAVLCRKGFWGSEKFRVVSIVHPHLKLFTSIVQYNPAEPPDDNYEAQGMQQAHQRTQSDFKGQKKLTH